jgi:hypothetical protein
MRLDRLRNLICLGYNVVMTTVNAHYLGKVLVPDEPLDLREGEAVELSIRRHTCTPEKGIELLARLPLIHLPAADAVAINCDPEFDAEEA